MYDGKFWMSFGHACGKSFLCLGVTAKSSSAKCKEQTLQCCAGIKSFLWQLTIHFCLRHFYLRFFITRSTSSYTALVTHIEFQTQWMIHKFWAKRKPFKVILKDARCCQFVGGLCKNFHSPDALSEGNFACFMKWCNENRIEEWVAIKTIYYM